MIIREKQFYPENALKNQSAVRKKRELALPLSLVFSLIDYSHNYCTYSEFKWHRMCIDDRNQWFLAKRLQYEKNTFFPYCK